MTLEQLRVFLAVAERGHMTDAARALGMSQSGTSAAIKALEEQYGVRLFNRVGRGIELSQDGERFLPEARAVLDRMAAARLVLENASHTVVGSIAIAASLTIASYWLPARLASFLELYPAVKLDVTYGNTQEVERAVLDGTADIGLVEGRTRSDVLTRRSLDTDRLLFVVARNFSLPEDMAPGIPDLRKIRWIIREKGSGTRDALNDLAARFAMTLDDLQVFLVLPSNEAVRQAVEAGAGATIISERVVSRSIREGTLRQVPLEIPVRDFAMITHSGRQPSLAQSALRTHLWDVSTRAQTR